MLRRRRIVVEKRGTTIGGGAGLDKANVEIATVSGDGTVDMIVSAEGLVGMRGYVAAPGRCYTETRKGREEGNSKS